MLETLTLPFFGISNPSPPIEKALNLRRKFSISGASSASSSHYHVLQVNRYASSLEIKAAYRALAKVHHPDAHYTTSSDGGDFMAIHRAYATLSDPAARALYDVSIGAALGIRRRRLGSWTHPFSKGFYQTRRWETDQCW